MIDDWLDNTEAAQDALAAGYAPQREATVGRLDMNKAPFPYFGGKSKAAPQVWAALGDVAHYIEPFCGSMAVLLNRPHLANRPYYSETVNDADGLLVNFWRSIQFSPAKTARYASWPVAEADLHARHLALVRWQADPDRLAWLMADPENHDPKMGGWWAWGLSCWIGGGWCSGTGPWTEIDGRLVKQGKGGLREPGVKRERPHLGNDGRGVNHAGLREPGVASPDLTMPQLVRWFEHLSARLRHVRILNGDWQRAVTSGASKTLPVRQGKGVCGVYLDPPYRILTVDGETNRTVGLYAVDDGGDVATAALEWAIEHGADPDYRVVFAGLEGEHGDAFERAGWRELEWFSAGFLTGGMGNTGSAGHQQSRERHWVSPHCLDTTERPQLSLFEES